MKKIFLFIIYFYSFYLLGQNIIWENHLYDNSYNYTSFKDILDTNNGGCLALAYVEFYDDPQDRYCELELLRYDNDGNYEFLNGYLSDIILNEKAKIISVEDGGYAIMTTCENENNTSYISILRVDVLGNIMWVYNYGNNMNKMLYAKDIIENNQHGFTIAVSDETNDEHIFPLLISIDSTGTFQWVRMYNDIARNFHITAIEQEPYGEYYFVGNIKSVADGEMLFSVTRTDAAGIFISRRIYRDSNYNWGMAIKRLFDGNFVLSGYTGPTVDSEVFAPFIYLTDENGEIIWENDYLEFENFDNRETGFFVNDNYNFMVMTSEEGTYPYIFEVNRYTSQIEWHIDFVDDTIRFIDMIQNSQNQQTYYTIIGNGWYNGQTTGYIVKLSKYNVSSCENEIELSHHIFNYPNPFNPKTTIYFTIPDNERGILTIFNEKGQKVFSKNFSSGNHEYVWDANRFVSGLYFYQIKTRSERKIGKMILLK